MPELSPYSSSIPAAGPDNRGQIDLIESSVAKPGNTGSNCNDTSAESRNNNSKNNQPETAVKSSWRSWLRVHPLADRFPLLLETDTDALKELAEDIKKNGQREPATYIKDATGQIILLDGRNRLDALELLGRKIELNDSTIFQQQLSADIDIYAYIASKNIHRRHLTAKRKRELMVQFADWTKSDRAIADEFKTNKNTVGRVRKEFEKKATVPIGTVGKRTGKDGRVRKKPKTSGKPKKLKPLYRLAPGGELIARCGDARAMAESGLTPEAWAELEDDMGEGAKAERKPKVDVDAPIAQTATAAVASVDSATMAVDIERLACRLIGNDAESARDLHMLLCEGSESVAHLARSLGRELGLAAVDEDVAMLPASSVPTEQEPGEDQDEYLPEPLPRTKRKSKVVEETTTFAEAIMTAFGEFAELASECREVVDNAPSGISETQRIQTLDETANALEDLEAPEIPDELAKIKVSFSTHRARSRADRRDAALDIIRACGTALEDLDEKHPSHAETCRLKEELENAASGAECCEFPGMYG
jgi:ParB-like nuclease domain